MTGVAGALLALVLHARPPTDTGVWLTTPAAESVVPARLDVVGEAQAPEGVLRLDLYVVRGTSLTKVDSYTPLVPVGTVAFTLHWSRGAAAPGRVTVRVVATTLLRGLSAESADLVVPGHAPQPRPRVAHPLPEPPAPVPAPHGYAARRAVVARPVLDDSGRPFGAVAPVLPYVTSSAAPDPPAAAAPLHTTAVRTPVPPDRQGAVSVAAGLLLLLVCSHLHRVLRTRPDPRDPA
jgi:hypothetical protein